MAKRMAEKLTIKLLGSVSIELGGKPVIGLPSRKVEALLVYLVCHERPFPREFLADLLWDDRPQTQALANLRSILSSLRRVLGPYLAVTRQTVAFNHESDYWLDMQAFASALDASQTHSHLNLEECAECVRELETAVTLYNGRFLQGLIIGDSPAFEEWSLIVHEQTQRRVLTALHQLGNHYARQGKYAQAQRYALRQVELEPYREEAHRQLMFTLVRSGQRSAALAQYEICRRILNKELGVEPAAETRSLYQRIRSAGKASPHNLPPSLTPLIGREKELQQIAAHLADPACRLLTLTGSGGIGKTLLALQAAREHTGIYLHGIYFIPLAPIADPDLLGTTIADAIHCPLDGTNDLQTQLLDFLREKELLLILDNFEHLLTGSSWISQIIQAAPHVNYLVTSRERLNIRGECLLKIRGLAYPTKTGETPAQAEAYSAIQLFMRAARRVKPDYAPFLDEMRHVIRICQHLEGMPLGIELAAAWIRLVSSADIWREIERDLDFLATSLRDVPDRHQSMRLVFRQSWHLLTPAEQTALSKLAVFRGPFSQAAARHVAGANFHMLLSLADKSLLRRTADEQFDLHKLLKQYLAEKLTQRPEAETAAYDAHGRYFARFLAEREQALKGGRQAHALAEIALAIEDIRAAWQWAVRHKQFALLGQTAESLYLFFWARNRFAEGKAVFVAGINAIAADDAAVATSILLARLQSRMAEMALWLGEYEVVEVTLQESIVAFRRHQVNHELMLALEILGRLFYAQGAYAPARRCFEESLTISRQIGSKEGAAQALSDLATTICTETADYAAAKQLLEDGLALSRDSGHRNAIIESLISLGRVSIKTGDYQDAGEYLAEALQMAADIQTPQLMLGVLKEYARLFFATGRKEQAVTCLQILLNYPLEAQELKEQARLLLNKFAPDAVLEDGGNGRSQPTALTLEKVIETVLTTSLTNWLV